MAIIGTPFTFLMNQLRTASGDNVAGKVYFYEVGTDTIKPVYSDYLMTTEAANPYTLSANSQCLLYGFGAYRVVVKSPALVTLYDWDNVYLLRTEVLDATVDVPPDVADGDVWTTDTGMFMRVNGVTKQFAFI